MGRFGFWEIILIVGVGVLLFGTSRLSDFGKGLGEGIRNFKKGIKEDDEPKQLPEKKDPSEDEKHA